MAEQLTITYQAVIRAEIATLQARIDADRKRLPQLRLNLQVWIEIRVASLNRELRQLADQKRTACSGECDMTLLLDAESALDDCLESIAGLEGQVEDLESELQG